MNLYFRLRYIRRKSLAKKGSRRRFKRVASGRKSISCSKPTQIYIPLDLQIDTLSRLPVESLLRFRCVSKLWSSIITSRDFRNRHLNITASSAPHLLIAFNDYYGNKLTLVSLPKPNASSSSCRVPYGDLRLLNFQVQEKSLYNAAQGLICVANKVNVGLCNPSTRQLHYFPQTKFKHAPEFNPHSDYFFGYDPVEDQYKVLAVDIDRLRAEIAVFGGGGWRDVPFVACPHDIHTSRMYMNGTIYYGASRNDIHPPNNSMIVSFDVRLETFNIIKVPSKLVPIDSHIIYKAGLWACTTKTLINYGGKIGVVEEPHFGEFRMWIVEDAEKEEWSVNTFHLPRPAPYDLENVMDTFYTGEICLVQKTLSDPFCLFYYNFKTNSMRSVTIEGLPMSELKQVRGLSVTVSDHYESLMFLET